jgi:NO-binding membrane sensor protein with MHYT domain
VVLYSGCWKEISFMRAIYLWRQQGTTAAAPQICLNSSSLFETMACFSHYAQAVPKLFGGWRRNWLFISSMSDVVGVRGRHFLRLLGFDVDCVEWNLISK